ncbi:unnamed protein product [Closterium sp. NIES-53]
MAGTMKRTRKLQISCGDEEDDAFPSHGLWEIKNADVDRNSTVETKPGGATGSGSGTEQSYLETSLVRESSVIPTPSTTTTVTTSIADFSSSGYGESVSSAWDHILGSDATPTGSGGRGLHDSPLTPTPPTPIHDKILQATSIEIGHVGTLTWRQLAVDRDLRLISWWHHVPLYSRDGLLNFVCATPRGSWIKYEVAQDEEFTPLRIARFPAANAGTSREAAAGASAKAATAGDRYSRPAHFAENATRFSLGFLPQTYADPAQPNPDYGGLAYQGGPMDALLLDLNDASRAGFTSLAASSISWLPSRDLRTGDVCQVKVVGAFAVVQQKSHLSWKLLAIPAVANAGRSGSGAGGEDDVADQINDVADVHAMFPGLLDDIREWLRFCDCVDPDGEENEFGLNQRAGAADVALAIIAQAHASWQLLTDDTPPPSPWSPANLVLSVHVLQEKWQRYTDKYYMEAACKGDEKGGSGSGGGGGGGSWEGERGGRGFSVGSLGSWQGRGASGSVSGVSVDPLPLNLPFVPFSDPTTSRAERRFDRAWEETSRGGSFAGESGVGNGLRFGSSFRESRISSYGGSSEGPATVMAGLRNCKSGPMVVRFGVVEQEAGEEGRNWGRGEEGNQEQEQEKDEEGHGSRSNSSVECGGMESGTVQTSTGASESAGGGGTAAAAFAAAAAGGGGMKARRKSGSWDFGNMTVGGVWIPDALAERNSVTTGNTVTSFNTIGGRDFATAAFADICAPNENDSATVAEATSGNRVTLTGNKVPATEHSRGFPLFRHSSLNRALLNDHRTALARLGALWGAGGGSDRPPPEPDTQVRESSKPDGEVRGSSKPDGAGRAVQRRWGGWRYGPLGGRIGEREGSEGGAGGAAGATALAGASRTARAAPATVAPAGGAVRTGEVSVTPRPLTAESPCVGGGGIGTGRRRRGRQGNSNWPSLSSSSFGDASIADTLDLASPRTSLSDAWDQALISSLDDDASLLPLPPTLASAWDSAGAVGTGAIAGSVRGAVQQGVRGGGGACVASQTREILACSQRLAAGVQVAAAAAAVVAGRVGEAPAATGGGAAAGSAAAVAAAAVEAEQEGVCSTGNGRQQRGSVDAGLESGGEGGEACSREWASLECDDSDARMDPCDSRLGDSSGMQGSSWNLGIRPVSAVSSLASVASTSSVVTAVACHGTGIESPKAEMRGMREDGTGVGKISLGVSLPTTPSLPSSLPSPTSTVSSATISLPRTYSSSGYGLSPPNQRGQVRSEVLQLPAWVDEKVGARGNGGDVGMGRERGSEEVGLSEKESEEVGLSEKEWKHGIQSGSLAGHSAVGSGISGNSGRKTLENSSELGSSREQERERDRERERQREREREREREKERMRERERKAERERARHRSMGSTASTASIAASIDACDVSSMQAEADRSPASSPGTSSPGASPDGSPSTILRNSHCHRSTTGSMGSLHGQCSSSSSIGREAAYTRTPNGDQFSTPAYKGDASGGDNCGGVSRRNGEGGGERRGVLKQSLSWEERGGSKAVPISHPLFKVIHLEAQGAEGTESEGEERREKAWERKREEREWEWERERERFVVGSVSFKEAERKEERGSESKGVIDKGEEGGVMVTDGCVGGSEAREERCRKMKRQVSFNSVVKVYEYDDVQ